jgi:hypothetical protein
MLVRDLISYARALLDDKVLTGTSARDLLYSDEELLLWVNEAVNEAALRTQGIREARDYVFTAGTHIVPLGGDVLSVDEYAVFHTTPIPKRKHIRNEDATSEAWGRTTAIPTQIAYMRTPSELWIDTSPPTDFTVTVDVALYLTNKLTPTDNIPLPEYQHTGLVNWILGKAYVKHDTETENLARSQHAMRQFDYAFGARQPFSQVEVMRDTRTQRTKPSYF